MTAQIVNFWDYKRPEEKLACNTRLERKLMEDAARILTEAIMIPPDYDPRPDGPKGVA